MPPLKAWNEDLVRALITRREYYRATNNGLQYTFGLAVTRMQSVRGDIKLRRDGVIVNLPTFD